MKSLKGFSPIVSQRSRTLILGSMPSVASIDRREYYGHSRNAFWHIICALFAKKYIQDYQKRKKIILANGLALWDVIASCQRQGSADSAIKNPQINDFDSFFRRYLHIDTICFNGMMAMQLFKRNYTEPSKGKDRSNRIKYLLLPSTSPANARINFASKLQIWKKALCGRQM